MRSARSRLRGPGGARRSRTDDILLAKQALYQLSYGPSAQEEPGRVEHRRAVGDCRKAGPAGLVGPGRLELPTLRLSGVRSNQAELRAYGGTTARQETQARDRTPNHRRPNASASWKRKRKEKRRRRRPAVYWSSNRQSRERRPGGTSLERR